MVFLPTLQTEYQCNISKQVAIAKFIVLTIVNVELGWFCCQLFRLNTSVIYSKQDAIARFVKSVGWLPKLEVVGLNPD